MIIKKNKSTSGSSLKRQGLQATYGLVEIRIDVGLVKRFNQLDASLLLQEDIILLNQGALAEQFVGQKLLAYSDNYEKTKLYFGARDGHGTAEVDYVKVIGSTIFPIKVKSGKTGTLRSLKQYLLEHEVPFGIRISQQNISFENNRAR